MKCKPVKIALLLSLTLLLNGCGPVNSLFSLYQADDTAFEEGLLGTWQPVITEFNEDDKDTRWTFEHLSDDKFYAFTWGSVKGKGGFAAKTRLVKLSDNLFIDFEGDTSRAENLQGKELVVPFPVTSTHMIGRIWLEKDSLKVRLLGQDWVDKQIKAGTFSLSRENVDGSAILTAKAADLRKFMQEHADDDVALSEEFKLVRSK